MSYEYEGTVSTSATPADVWRLWSDVGSWHCWDPAVQVVAIEGHFGEGAGGTLTLTGGVHAPFYLELVEPGSRFLDRITIGELTVYIDHVVKATADGAEVTVRTSVSGPNAEELGPVVAADTPKALEALVAMAEQKS
ncbi:MAG: SRPBCC family protein [Nocardioides sp.]|nr:SRPBCC family protein [Nocardioidaceae bacterium]MCB8955112.1 SRPBCC family protein [Nocardioides sp.]